jgi:hypothetical protein
MTDLLCMTTCGVSCDAKGCAARIRGPERPLIDRAYQYEAIDAGWSIWIGRSRRHYCPKHGPKPGHRMTEWKPQR